MTNLAPNTLVSDNAKSFKCVWTSTFYKYRELLNKEPYIGQGPRIEWRFNASCAPWWGGFYERMMTLIKEKMARCFVGKEFTTLAAFTEAVSYVQKVINSRPITWCSEGSMEQKPLIPAHFLYVNAPGFEDPYN